MQNFKTISLEYKYVRYVKDIELKSTTKYLISSYTHKINVKSVKPMVYCRLLNEPSLSYYL